MSFLRYVMIQVAAYVIDLGSFTLLISQTGLQDVLANAGGKLLAGIFAFFAHRYFTFQMSRSGNVSGQALRYFALLGLNIPLSSAVLYGLSQLVPAIIVAKVISDGICIVITYSLSRQFVFRSTEKKGG